MSEPLRLGAVILTGGTAARMDGIDKAAIEIGGVTLLERALAATMAALEVVVVGREVPTSRPVTWTREDPPLGGPAAGILAGLDRFLRTPDLVCVLAVDMPKVNAGTVARLTWAGAPPASDCALDRYPVFPVVPRTIWHGSGMTSLSRTLGGKAIDGSRVAQSAVDGF